jgi:hypothetical protein
MSRRRRLPLDPLELLDPPDVEDPDDELVEYLVDVLPESWVVTSVPNSAHESQTWSSAPSILTVLGLAVSAPHISH